MPGQTFSYASGANIAAANSNVVKTLLAKSFSTFFIKGELGFINDF